MRNIVKTLREQQMKEEMCIRDRLQCAEGFPGVLRAARFEDSECRRLLEEAAEDDGRGDVYKRQSIYISHNSTTFPLNCIHFL